MPPVMRNDSTDGSQYGKPCVNLALKAGWSFDAARNQFVSEDGTTLSLGDKLPRGTKVVPTVPSLAAAAYGTLSEPERHLARSMQVILTDGEDPAAALRVIRQWACVDQAHLPPAIALPNV